MDSILDSVKKIVGIDETYDAFDADLIIHVNSVLMALTQMGVGPTEGFTIHGSEEAWSDFIGDALKIEAVKSYVALKVRLIFDPPTSSAVTDAINKTIGELEWRLSIACGNFG